MVVNRLNFEHCNDIDSVFRDLIFKNIRQSFWFIWFTISNIWSGTERSTTKRDWKSLEEEFCIFHTVLVIYDASMENFKVIMRNWRLYLEVGNCCITSLLPLIEQTFFFSGWLNKEKGILGSTAEWFQRWQLPFFFLMNKGLIF